jgi:Fe-S-cluster containining protein
MVKRNHDLRIKLSKEELDKLKKKCEKTGLSLSGFVFCLEYGMFNQPCPFLENNKCSIYNNRALVCRQFPIFYVPQFNPTGTFGGDCFLKCQHFENKKQLDDNFKVGSRNSAQDIIDYLKEVYGECYDYALQSNALKKFLADFLQTMIKQKQIKLREISKFDLSKYKVMSFFDFMVYKNLMDNNTKNYLIQTFKNKEAFQEFINKQNARQSNNL